MNGTGFQKVAIILATMTVILGVISWIITFSVDPKSSPYATAWQVTWILNPIGLIFSIYLLSKGIKHALLLLLLNLLLIISFGPMWFIGDFINMLSS